MSRFVQWIRKSAHFPKFDLDRFMGGGVYIICFLGVFCLLLLALLFLGAAFFAPRSSAFWQGIIHFPLIVFTWGGLFHVGFVLIGAGLLWWTYAYGRRSVIDFLAWKNFSYMRQLALYHSARRQLAFFYALARFENERFQFSQRRESEKIQEGNMLDDDISFDGTIQRVGPFSWFYLFLFNYLLPSSAIQERQAFFTYLRQFPNMAQISPEKDAGMVALPALLVASESANRVETTSMVQIHLDKEQESSHPSLVVSSSGSDNAQVEALALKQETHRSGSIYVFAKQPTIFLGEDERVPLRIKDSRRLSLFMYLAVYAKQHTIHGNDIINVIYEKDESRVRDEEENEGEKENQLRQRFYKDVRLLRQLFKQTAQRAHITYSDPIEVDGKGKQAVWSLSESYEVVDVAALEQFFQQGLKSMQAHPDLPMEEFRKMYKTIIDYYQKGFLSELVRKKEVGNWARVLQTAYQDMYRHIIWKVAEYEKDLGLKSSQEGRNTCFQQAAWLYEKYAREIAYDKLPGSENPPPSETALQEAMHLYVQIGRGHDALRAYQEYGKAIMRRRQNWKPHFQTEQIRQKIAQGL